ncbi:amidohydrolase family protein [uncultured Ferrovibrio sp.]|jgi:imidazolonepropionase-like amidohydrolase|uniref:amidohydrolase family protein n=1 Tax=uncultured Ferrovibrio sp. TaxID=1576913 RepID=UPI00261C8146|nr:amidohydrolase family protein [uncultured Ferrovibrio sp.]
MTSKTKKLVIKNGTVIDGTGKAPMANTTVVVEGNKITSVGGQIDAATLTDATVIDATGKYVMPGMIDGHVHLSSHQGAIPGVRYTSSPDFAALWTARIVSRVLHAGVTGVSVPGGKWFVDATIREAVNGGLIEGPRIFCAGRALTPYGGIFDSTNPLTGKTADDSVGVLCNTIDDYIRETKRQCKRGVDMIKIADSYWGDTQTVSRDEIAAVADEAHRRGKVVSIHARGSGSTRDAALGGVDWIFHADLATEQDLEVVAKAGIPIMPVFTQCQLITEQDESKGFTKPMRERVRAQLEKNFEAIRKARAMGIEILVGTDSGNAAAFEHGRYHGREAEILVNEIGMSPMEAIVAYTSRNAKVIGLDGQVGEIAPGKLADIIIWDKDPLADIRVLQKPELLSAVIKDGRVIDRSVVGFRHLETEPGRANITPQG